MRIIDIEKHVRGESQFIDDINVPEGTLYAAVFDSKIAHGKILNINVEEAESISGVRAILTAKDIPGINQVGGIIPDETLFAEGEVQFVGEPLGVVVSDSYEIAKKAANKIKIDYEKLPVIVDPREAFEKGSLIMPPRTFSFGNVDTMWDKCDVVLEGKVESGGQEHLYLETQGCIAIPQESGKIKLISATQSPTTVQRTAARVLGVEMNNIEVDVLRLGGAFGGKEDQATHWAIMSALAAHKLGKPVKLVLNRMDDIRMTGKRHPYSSDYKIGLTSEGKILAFEATYFQNAGAFADLSPAILDRTLFHATNSYFIPNIKTTGISCKTNLQPNTAFRGFGGPQGKFVIEAAIYKAAEKIGMDVSEIQRKNLLKHGDSFYYGQPVENCQAEKCWIKSEEKYNVKNLKREVEDFNRKNYQFKKGIALMPICFGISFTNTLLNQASALVHVYIDGSIGVSTAAVEMGQGVNEKIKTAVAKTFSVSHDRIRIETTNTTRVANTSATAASSGADLNGNAAILASKNILDRLLKVAADELKVSDAQQLELRNEVVFMKGVKTNLVWNELIKLTYQKRISLSSQTYYATPNIYFDKETNKGRPFAYHVYGMGIITATLDCLRGIYTIDSVKVVHDFGKSLNPVIDLGQAEGGIAQGIGWLTAEEVMHSDEGKLLSNSLSTYKIPDIYAAPKEIEVTFLEDSENQYGPFNSKAIGEPPLMYGIGAYFAILNAMKAFRPEKKFEINAPITPEKVLMNLYSKIDESVPA
ncbi:MAG: molybdopterin-dependent oxidoreductase [Ignavibacteria bacterium]|nr:molybdopterin-dependent oxidoreductase [Ignavibacteria bacterium]